MNASGLQVEGSAAGIVANVTQLVKGSQQPFFSEIPPTLLSVPAAVPQVFLRWHDTYLEYDGVCHYMWIPLSAGTDTAVQSTWKNELSRRSRAV